jgi:hypothetical protein
MSYKGFLDYLKEAETKLAELVMPKPIPRPIPRPGPRPVEPRPVEPKPKIDQPKPGEAPTRPTEPVPGEPIPPRPAEPKPAEPKPAEPKPTEPSSIKPTPVPVPHSPEELGTMPEPQVVPKPKPDEVTPKEPSQKPIPIPTGADDKPWRWYKGTIWQPGGTKWSDKVIDSDLKESDFTYMSDIQKSLFIIETMSTAEKKPTGPKFPGYWKGTDPASAAKNKMVGGSEEQQESVLGELDKAAKDSVIRRTLEEKFKAFKEQDTATKPVEGPGGAAFGVYPQAISKKPATPTTMDPKDIDPSAIAMAVPGSVGLAAQLATISPELNKGEEEALRKIRQQAGIPEPKPATAADHIAAIRKAEADPYSMTPPGAKIAASGPLTKSADVAASTGASAKTEPEVKTAPPASQSPAELQGLDVSGRKTGATDPRSSTYGTTAPTAVPEPKSAASAAPAVARQPVTPPAGEGLVGKELAQYGISRTARRDQSFVDKELGAGYKAGSAEANLALLDKYQKQSGKPAPTPAQPAIGSSARIQTTPSNAVVSGSGQPVTDTQGRPVTSGGTTDADGRPIQLPPAFAAKPQKQTAFNPEQDKEYRKGMGQREGLGRYDTTFGDTIDKDGNLVHKYMPPPKPITDMTIQELQAWQKERSAKDKGTGAVGMYGFMPSTIDEYSKKAGLKPTDIFNKEAQEKIQSAIMADQYNTLQQNDVPINAGTMYMAHYLGSQGAVRVMKNADPNQTVVDAMIDPKYKSNPETYQAERNKILLRNPELGKIKAGDFETVLANRVARGQMTAQQKQAQQGTQVAMRESDNKKVAGRYSYDEFDDMIDRLRVKAKEQEKKHGPVDLGKLMQRLRDIDDKDKNVKEEESPNIATNPTMQATAAARQATNPALQDTQAGMQATSQAGTVQQQQQRRDQAIDTSTARGVADTIASVAPPGTNPDVLAQGIVNANDGKPLNIQQQKAMSTITPLVLKAAETPVAAGALKTALQQAGILAKQGK